MGDMASIGKLIIGIGIAIVVFGGIVILISRFSGGRGAPLPGDIVIHRDGVTIYFPIVTMLVVSIILSLVFRLISWLHR